MNPERERVAVLERVFDAAKEWRAARAVAVAARAQGRRADEEIGGALAKQAQTALEAIVDEAADREAQGEI